ncbi:hypothetical protein J5N97_016621 [Dioscorea zingiberensis]|uniref:Uncharacterized protein n=1 Tax=Dioscorea zingiberensis TaxID=325984 RepID=A0A9D5HFC6_9LILI|nr:hypothetical protein J5N97_016621 [Dioscorea zingiberensis]
MEALNSNEGVPKSPRRHIISSFPHYIYAIPSSPSKGLSTFVSSCESISSSSSVTDHTDEFEFKVSLSSDVDSSSSSSFINCGRLLPLPPRLQPSSSPISSRGSSTRKLKLSSVSSLPSLSFRNKDFDPFMAAVENIRKEDVDECNSSGYKWRTKSMQPLRELNNKSKKSRRKTILEFFFDSKSTLANIIKEKVIGSSSSAALRKKKEDHEGDKNRHAYQSGKRIAEEKKRFESLARCMKSTHPTNLTAWFGSARQPL